MVLLNIKYRVGHHCSIMRHGIGATTSFGVLTRMSRSWTGSNGWDNGVSYSASWTGNRIVWILIFDASQGIPCLGGFQGSWEYRVAGRAHLDLDRIPPEHHYILDKDPERLQILAFTADEEPMNFTLRFILNFPNSNSFTGSHAFSASGDLIGSYSFTNSTACSIGSTRSQTQWSFKWSLDSHVILIIEVGPVVFRKTAWLAPAMMAALWHLFLGVEVLLIPDGEEDF